MLRDFCSLTNGTGDDHERVMFNFGYGGDALHVFADEAASSLAPGWVWWWVITYIFSYCFWDGVQRRCSSCWAMIGEGARLNEREAGIGRRMRKTWSSRPWCPLWVDVARKSNCNGRCISKVQVWDSTRKGPGDVGCCLKGRLDASTELKWARFEHRFATHTVYSHFEYLHRR